MLIRTVAIAATLTVGLIACTQPGSSPSSSSPPVTPSGATVPPSHTRSASPPGESSGGRAFALTTGSTLLENTIDAETAPVEPKPSWTVLTFITTYSSGTEAPTPTLTGGGVHWSEVGEYLKKDAADRKMTLFTATDVHPGPLSITVPGAAPKVGLCWTLAAAPGRILRTAQNTGESLETSHSVSLDPTGGVVVAGFLVGQQETIHVQPPYRVLGQAHTLAPGTTCLTAWGPGGTATVDWTTPGHALGVAVNVG